MLNDKLVGIFVAAIVTLSGCTQAPNDINLHPPTAQKLVDAAPPTGAGSPKSKSIVTSSIPEQFISPRLVKRTKQSRRRKPYAVVAKQRGQYTTSVLAALKETITRRGIAGKISDIIYLHERLPHKVSVRIKLHERISKASVHALGEAVQKAAPSPRRRFVEFVLPRYEGFWATAHSAPELQAKINGMSLKNYEDSLTESPKTRSLKAGEKLLAEALADGLIGTNGYRQIIKSRNGGYIVRKYFSARPAATPIDVKLVRRKDRFYVRECCDRDYFRITGSQLILYSTGYEFARWSRSR